MRLSSERLAPDLQGVAAAPGPSLPAAHPVVREGHLTRHWHPSATDRPDIGDGVMGGAKRPGRDQSRAVAREAGDAMDTRGLNGFGQGHGRQDDGEPPGQHRRARPRGAEQEDGVGTTPVSR
jgi:hypothetical protein